MWNQLRNGRGVMSICRVSHLIILFITWVILNQDGLFAEQKPNVVIVIADDQGYGDLGHTGNPIIKTPNIDALASESTSLTDYHVAPTCSPTRSALMTGHWTDRTGVWHTINGRSMLRANEVTLGQLLKDNGYTTGMFGKWHLGEWLPEHLPLARGFDHQYGHYGWGIDYNSHLIPHNAPQPFCVFDWHRDQQPVLEVGYSTDLIADEAIRLMKIHGAQDAPFFHYVAFNAIHGPLEEIPRHRDVFDKRNAAIKCLDDAVGRIVETVDDLGISEKTLVFFTNDNGGLTEEVNRPWRGTKNTTFEGGIRVPCVLRWPGFIEQGSVCNELIHVTDIFPTLVTIGGGSLEQTYPLDGSDMSPVIFDGKKSSRTEILIEATGSVRLPSIRSGRWKLVGDALFDLERDPGERRDVSEMNLEIVIKLRNRMLTLSAERPPLGELSEVMNPALPYVYGQAEDNSVSEKIRHHVEHARRSQQQIWEAGKYPWPAPPRNGQITYEGDGR